jgi:polar amino acid transport system substrate-binding protein
MGKLTSALRIGALALALAAGIAKAEAQQARQALSADCVIEQIKKRGTLRAGLAVFVPWAMPDRNGKLVGFEVDVINRLAADMGVKAEPVLTAWDGIIPALIAGKIDVIIGGLGITPKRNLTINYSIPYEQAEIQVIVNKKLLPNVKSLDDLNQPSITIANRRGATTETITKAVLPKATQILFDDENASLQEVLNGKAQVVLAQTPTPSLWLDKYPDVLAQPIKEPLSIEPSAFGLRKGDPDALNYFDSWIIVHTADGWLQQRFNYWFKSRAWKDQVAVAN